MKIKLRKGLQWFVSVCFILSGLGYIGEYTIPAIVLMVLAGVIILPPVTRRIPKFKLKKAVIIAASLVMLMTGMSVGESTLSPEVQAKREIAAASAASSKAAEEARRAAESASRAVKEAEEAALKEAQAEAEAASKEEAEKATSNAASQSEASKAQQENLASSSQAANGGELTKKQRKKVEKYKKLFAKNYAHQDQISNGDMHKIYAAVEEKELDLAALGWREALYDSVTSYIDTRTNGCPWYVRVDEVFDQYLDLWVKYYYASDLGDVAMDMVSEEMEYKNTYTEKYFKKLFQSTYGDMIPFNMSEYKGASDRNFYITQKLSDNDWVGYEGSSPLGASDDPSVIRTKMTFPESGIYQLACVDSGQQKTLQDDRGFESKATLYYAYNPDTFYDAYEKLYTEDVKAADLSAEIIELLESGAEYETIRS